MVHMPTNRPSFLIRTVQCCRSRLGNQSRKTRQAAVSLLMCSMKVVEPHGTLWWWRWKTMESTNEQYSYALQLWEAEKVKEVAARRESAKRSIWLINTNDFMEKLIEDYSTSIRGDIIFPPLVTTSSFALDVHKRSSNMHKRSSSLPFDPSEKYRLTAECCL